MPPAGCCSNLDRMVIAYATATSIDAGDASPGTELWVARLDGHGDRDDATHIPLGASGSEAYAVSVSPDGSAVYVSGDGFVDDPVGAAPGTVATVAYDAALGTPMWAAQYEGNSTIWDSTHGRSNRDSFTGADGTRLYVSAAFGPHADAQSYGLLAYDLN